MQMAKTNAEEVVAVIIKVAKLGQEEFGKALIEALNRRNSPKSLSGKQSLNKLMKDSSSLQNIEITDKNIKSFEESARAYNITYALKKSTAETPPKYIVYFKGKDLEQVYKAFKDYERKQLSKGERPSVVEQIKSIQKEQSKQVQRERTREKTKQRGVEH